MFITGRQVAYLAQCIQNVVLEIVRITQKKPIRKVGTPMASMLQYNSLYMHHIASHHIASHCISSHHIASHCISSLHITSHCISSHRIASHCISSHHIASHCISSHHIASHHITSHCISSHHITSHGIILCDQGCHQHAQYIHAEHRLHLSLLGIQFYPLVLISSSAEWVFTKPATVARHILADM